MRAKSILISGWVARKYSEFASSAGLFNFIIRQECGQCFFKVCNESKVRKGNFSDQLSWKDLKIELRGTTVTFRG